jgi:hypothetical protein
MIIEPNRPLIAKSYSAEWLQRERPQPMYDKTIHRLLSTVFLNNPGDHHNLAEDFKKQFLLWLQADRLNRFTGFQNGWQHDICIGCTHYIDDLYQTLGANHLMILEDDYRYHWRLDPTRTFNKLENLVPGKSLLISMPFPKYGDLHPQMTEILNHCLDLNIPVHIDAAWLGCVRDIEFDFSHPAISSFAISLSKGLGLGGHRIGLRFSRQRTRGPITIMNDFSMNCQGLMQVGLVFMKELGSNYLWNKYADTYKKICNDFSLTPTKAIHLAQTPQGPVGVRLLLRWLNDK